MITTIACRFRSIVRSLTLSLSLSRSLALAQTGWIPFENSTLCISTRSIPSETTPHSLWMCKWDRRPSETIRQAQLRTEVSRNQRPRGLCYGWQYENRPYAKSAKDRELWVFDPSIFLRFQVRTSSGHSEALECLDPRPSNHVGTYYVDWQVPVPDFDRFSSHQRSRHFNASLKWQSYGVSQPQADFYNIL